MLLLHKLTLSFVHLWDYRYELRDVALRSDRPSYAEELNIMIQNHQHTGLRISHVVNL